MTKTKLTKRARALKAALSQVAMEYLEAGRIDVASRLHTVSNTLAADPKVLDKLAKILQEAKG